MASKYRLTVTPKGKRFKYTVVRVSDGVEMSSRLSVRPGYVACTVNGNFYFSRIDLVGKAAHGRELSIATRQANYTVEQWHKDRESYARELRKCARLESTWMPADRLESYKADLDRMLERRFPQEDIEGQVAAYRQRGAAYLESLEVVYLQ